MARIFFYAVLPGLALGLRTGAGFRLPPPETGLTLFIIAAFAGSFLAGVLVRRNLVYLSGLLAIFVFLPPPVSVWPIACAGLVFGALSRLPVPSRYRTIFAVFFAVGFGLISFAAALLPLAVIHLMAPAGACGALMLFHNNLKGGKWERRWLTLAAGIALLLCCVALDARDRSEPMRSISGRAFRVRPLPKSQIELNDPFGRRYLFPQNYERFAAAAPVIALQSPGGGASVLSINEVPALLPHLFKQFPWIARIDDIDRLRREPTASPSHRYELIVVTEFPIHATPDVRRNWIDMLRRDHLAANGALIYPAGIRVRPELDHELPFFPELRIAFADGRRPLATETALERRFSELGGDPETIPAGITTLLSLRGKEPQVGRNFTWQLPHTDRKLPWQCGIGLAIGWLIFRFWGGRYPGVGPAAAAAETGFLTGMAMWLIFHAAESQWLYGECRFALFPLWVGIVVPVTMKYLQAFWGWLCLLLLATAVATALLAQPDGAIPILWLALAAAAFRLGNLQEQAPAIRISRFYLAGLLVTVPLEMGGVF